MLTVHEYKNRIVELQRRREYREAYELLRTALDAYPTNMFLQSNEAYLLYKLNNLTEARKIAEGRMAILKNDVFFLRTYLSILEKLKTAKSDMEDVIERHIFHRNVGNEEFYAFVAQLILRNFGREKALDAANRALAFFHDSNVLKLLIDGLQKEEGACGKYKEIREKFKGQKTEDVIKEIESITVLPEYGSDHEIMAYLAELYKKQGNYAKAIDTYKHILTLKDSDFTRKMLGYAYYKTGDFDNALTYLKDTFLNAPHDHYLYSTIFRIFQEKNDFEGLQRFVNEAIGINPSAKHLYGLLNKAKKWQSH